MTRAMAILTLLLALAPGVLAAPGAPPAPPACRDCTADFLKGAVPIWDPQRHHHFFELHDPVFASCGRRFVARAHSAEHATRACQVAELRHPQVLAELDFTLREGPEELYLVTVFADQKELVREERSAPVASAGFIAANAIYITAEYDIDWGLTHEMVHLLVDENLHSNAKDSQSFRWFNEGLAGMLEPVPANAKAADVSRRVKGKLRLEPIPFQEMISRDWFQADADSNDRWRAQATDVVGFIRKQCGKAVINSLLLAVGDGSQVPEALAGACSGRWKTIEALEKDWKATFLAPTGLPIESAGPRP